MNVRCAGNQGARQLAREDQMKKLVLSAASLCMFVGCGTEYGQVSMGLSNPPAKSLVTSQLEVPAACVIYSPGGGDVDTVEDAYAAPFAFGCGVVVNAGNTLGLITGDAPTTQLATLPGDREIGIYRQMRPGFAIDVQRFSVTGPNPAVRAYLNHSNVCSVDTVGLPEANEANRIPVQIVAINESGFLLSLGSLGADAAHVSVIIDATQFLPSTPDLPWSGVDYSRFYLNGAPDLGCL